MNILVQVFVWTCVFIFLWCLQMESLGQRAGVCLVLQDIIWPLYKEVVAFYTTTNKGGSLLLNSQLRTQWGCHLLRSGRHTLLKVIITGLAAVALAINWIPQAVSHGQTNGWMPSQISLTLNLYNCFVGSWMSAFPFALIKSHLIGFELTLQLKITRIPLCQTPGDSFRLHHLWRSWY